jgi:hypothetical protein
MKSTDNGPQVFDLALDEEVLVDVGNGAPRRLRLLEVRETPDRIRGVIRDPAVVIEVDGERALVPAALYSMPRVVNGIKLDCAATRGIARALLKFKDVFVLEKDARIRCWHPESRLFGDTPMTYPVRQRWFASMTQLGNERTYVDAGELTLNDPSRHIYHHFGTDIGGYDKAVSIVAAATGRIVGLGLESAGDVVLGRQPRADVVLVRDDREWEYAYSHLDMIAPDLRINQRIKAGEFIGFLGQKGSSGGWSHLHFGIRAPQPCGRPGQVNAYPFFVEAYLHEHPGALLACARPHRVAGVDEEVLLDASNSICDQGEITGYRWNLSDGREVHGPHARIRYPVEGMYSEQVTVTDNRGQTDVDFCVVQILPADADPARTPPTMHVTSFPTRGIRPGQPVAFKARAFIRGPFAVNKAGKEEWDFGDGSRAASCSDDNFDERWHAYDAPGCYIVTVKRTAGNGRTATVQLKVIVDE